jgi:tetratricopeptide (TPR) repeat protein
MRYALVFAPWDPASPDIDVWSDEVAWLGATLAKLGFRVAVVDGEGDAQAQAARAFDNVGPGDTLLLHVSGYLARRGVLRTGGGAWLPIRALGELLAARQIADVSVLTELVHDDDPEDPLFASEQVDAVVDALEARDRGYGVVAAVRAASSTIVGFAFTRLLMDVAAAARPGDALLSKVFGRAAAMPQRLVTAQGIAFERGNVDLSLSAPPADEELDQLIAAATDAREWHRVVDLRLQRLATHDSPRARVRELVSIARILQTELDDPEGAIDALEEARTIDPTRIPVLQALRRGYERLGRWASAIETVGALADLAGTRSDRAELNYGRALLVLKRLEDPERAMELLKETLADDPKHQRARAALREIREREEASEGELDPDDLEEDAGQPGAVSVESAPKGTPLDANDDSVGHLDAAPAASGDLMDPATHAEAYAMHRREGGTDRAFLSALALEELGGADVEQQVLIDQFRTVAPIRARGMIDGGAWALLRAPGCNDAIESLFGAVARPALAVRFEELAARDRLVELDPATRLDDTSTALVSRTFHWAARVLGVPCPALYLVDQVPAEISAVPARKPSTVVGPSVVQGRSPKELAFLAARHLTYYRPEHEVAVYYPTRQELIRLLFAAVQIVRPRTAPPEGADAVAALRDRIASKIRDQERGALFNAVRLLESRGGKASVGSWMRGVEMTAARAGLLLCGDLATAMSLVRTESRKVAELSAEEKRRDLIAFCVSDAHAALRVRFAVTAPESVPPPARFAPAMAREVAAEASAPD